MMERDLRILVDTADKLVIQSPPRETDYFIIIFVVCMMSYALYKFWTNSARAYAIGLVVIAIPISWLVYDTNKYGYQMEMDRAKNVVLITPFTGTSNPHFDKTVVLPLDRVERADMEFDRNYRRITLTVRNGTPFHPLGLNYEIMDSQFKALGLIQSFIEQGPYQAPRTLDPPR